MTTFVTLALVGCADYHGRGDPSAPPDAEPDPGREGPPDDPGDGSGHADVIGPGEVCEPLVDPIRFDLGDAQSCQVQTFMLERGAVCTWHDFIDTPAEYEETRGAGVVIHRAVPGRVDVRIGGCVVDLARLEPRFCGRCSVLGWNEDPFITDIRRFPDDGTLEFVVGPGTFGPIDPPPCEVTMEVCFDPDYGAPDWASP